MILCDSKECHLTKFNQQNSFLQHKRLLTHIANGACFDTKIVVTKGHCLQMIDRVSQSASFCIKVEESGFLDLVLIIGSNEQLPVHIEVEIKCGVDASVNLYCFMQATNDVQFNCHANQESVGSSIACHMIYEARAAAKISSAINIIHSA